MLGATTGLADGLLTLGQEDSHPGAVTVGNLSRNCATGFADASLALVAQVLPEPVVPGVSAVVSPRYTLGRRWPRLAGRMSMPVSRWEGLCPR